MSTTAPDESMKRLTVRGLRLCGPGHYLRPPKLKRIVQLVTVCANVWSRELEVDCCFGRPL